MQRSQWGHSSDPVMLLVAYTKTFKTFLPFWNKMHKFPMVGLEPEIDHKKEIITKIHTQKTSKHVA